MINRYLLSNEDRKWLGENFPELIYFKTDNTIIGKLKIEREFININLDLEFSIKVILFSKPNSILPQVYVGDNKIEKIASQLGKKTEDLHVNKDKTLCLCISEEELHHLPNGFQVSEFFNNLLIPFLYWITYFQTYERPPWEDYSHGELGYIEMYGDRKINLKRLEILLLKNKNFTCNSLVNIKGHHPCICQSGNILRKCHRRIYYAIDRLKKESN